MDVMTDMSPVFLALTAKLPQPISLEVRPAQFSRQRDRAIGKREADLRQRQIRGHSQVVIPLRHPLYSDTACRARTKANSGFTSRYCRASASQSRTRSSTSSASSSRVLITNSGINAMDAQECLAQLGRAIRGIHIQPDDASQRGGSRPREADRWPGAASATPPDDRCAPGPLPNRSFPDTCRHRG